ncbi:MAG TPA: hypothetical protein VEP30_10065 [Chthoniobacterales bacterium]|nr:hypothetical protein [Chthoniobacterales bacterium]
MSNLEGITNNETRIPAIIFRRSSFVIRISSFRSGASFTIIELLVVIAIIIILGSLILSTVGYVQKKGARSRAEAEIAAMSAALESYKADNGIYPRDTATTDAVDARAAIDFSKYQTASQYLYGQLAADADFDGVPDTSSKSYMQFKPNQLGKDANGKLYLRDPFGNSYGYSTAYQSNASTGYNPTYDLWSTAGATSGTNQAQWIKNW